MYCLKKRLQIGYFGASYSTNNSVDGFEVEIRLKEHQDMVINFAEQMQKRIVKKKRKKKKPREIWWDKIASESDEGLFAVAARK